MTFEAVFQDFMDGHPITRTSWVEKDETRIVFYDLKTKSFVDRHDSEEWQSKYLCLIDDDLNATDWEICEWEDAID